MDGWQAKELRADQSRLIRETIDVPVRSLSDYSDEANIIQADFIKMDVEGFEAEVLVGGSSFLKSTRPRAILLEENRFEGDKAPPETFQLLQELGYKVHAIPRNLIRSRMVTIDRPSAETAHDFLALAGDETRP